MSKFDGLTGISVSYDNFRFLLEYLKTTYQGGNDILQVLIVIIIMEFTETDICLTTEQLVIFLSILIIIG